MAAIELDAVWVPAILQDGVSMTLVALLPRLQERNSLGSQFRYLRLVERTIITSVFEACLDELVQNVLAPCASFEAFDYALTRHRGETRRGLLASLKKWVR